METARALVWLGADVFQRNVAVGTLVSAREMEGAREIEGAREMDGARETDRQTEREINR